MPFYKSQKSFTFIELLVVIAIIALLMSVIIISINPAELLRETRDVRRITDVNSLNRAVEYFLVSLPKASLGSNNTIYISIPSSNSDCSNLGLPPPPTGWSYACST